MSKVSQSQHDRVVITGIGAVTPVGCDVDSMWENLVAGKTNIKIIDRFDVSNEKVQIASMVDSDGELALDVAKYVSHIEQKSMDLFTVYAVAAADQAYHDAKFDLLTDDQRQNAAVIVGSGIGGLSRVASSITETCMTGKNCIGPFFIPSILINMAAGHIAMRYKLYAENSSVVSACATGLHNIGAAYRIIKNNEADFALAGGSESAITGVGMAGFTACRALTSNFNDEPHKASRPWDVKRSGFVMGEGAGIVAIERLSSALARRVKIYGEIVGYGASCDSYHITAPISDGSISAKAMRRAIDMAGIDASQIDYINAHGTSTMQGDIAEIHAMRRVFSNLRDIPISSTKSSLGHMLGAAGAVETIICLLAARNSIVPATINLDDPDEQVSDLNLVPHIPQKKDIQYTMNNSFGFGGTNASLIIKSYRD